MKKSLVVFSVALAILLVPTIIADSCNLDVSLINQDPYPAIPGDYVKVVFQIDGLSNPNCGVVDFRVKEEFPFSLDPGVQNPINIRSGTYSRSYSSFYIAPYQIRVSPDALEGDNPIEVSYTLGGSAEVLKEFDINIKDSRADFEVYVKDYDPLTHELTLEILNIEDVDVQALTVEIPKQDGIVVKGANRKVVGDLDSNEYTTTDFEATPMEGEVTLKIIYTDSINVRREINKTLTFDSSYYTDRNGSSKKKPIWLYVIIVLIIVWFIWRQYKKAQRRKHRHEKQHMHKK